MTGHLRLVALILAALPVLAGTNQAPESGRTPALARTTARRGTVPLAHIGLGASAVIARLQLQSTFDATPVDPSSLSPATLSVLLPQDTWGATLHPQTVTLNGIALPPLSAPRIVTDPLGAHYAVFEFNPLELLALLRLSTGPQLASLQVIFGGSGSPNGHQLTATGLLNLADWS